MSRVTITIRGDADRQKAHDLVHAAAFGSRVEFKQEKRSDDQNKKFWASLQDVADQVKWHGMQLTAEDYKLLFLDAMKRELRAVPNLDNNGFVNLGRSSSDLTKDEMSDMIELILAFGANHGVKFHDQPDSSAQPPCPTDTPATADPSPHQSAVAGTPSKLWPDWREIYLNCLTGPRDRPESLQTRDTNSRCLLGGIPNEQEEALMKTMRAEVTRWRRGEIGKDEWERARAGLMIAPLPEVETAA